MTVVAVLGVGKMGAAIAQVLADSGTTVRLWNRAPARAEALRGERLIPVVDQAEALDGVDAAISTLIDGNAVLSALDGIGRRLPPDALLIEASTIDPAAMAHIARGLEDRAVSCAVSGTPGVVLAGQAGVLVSGDPDAKARAAPVLAGFAARSADVGPRVEDAKLVKIGINAVLAGTMELLAESVVLLEAAGVDRTVFEAALSSSVLGSTFSGYKLAALARRDYAPTFATRDLRKDVGLALAEAAAGGVTLPFAERLAGLLDESIARGWGDLDFLSLVARMQLASGQPCDLTEA